MGIDALQHHVNFAFLRREFDGVGEQVPNNLLESSRIAADRARGWIDHLFQPKAFSIGRGADALNGALKKFRKIDHLHVEAHLTGNDSTYVEQVLNELG